MKWIDLSGLSGDQIGPYGPLDLDKYAPAGIMVIHCITIRRATDNENPLFDKRVVAMRSVTMGHAV